MAPSNAVLICLYIIDYSFVSFVTSCSISFVLSKLISPGGLCAFPDDLPLSMLGLIQNEIIKWFPFLISYNLVCLCQCSFLIRIVWFRIKRAKGKTSIPNSQSNDEICLLFRLILMKPNRWSTSLWKLSQPLIPICVSLILPSTCRPFILASSAIS